MTDLLNRSAAERPAASSPDGGHRATWFRYLCLTAGTLLLMFAEHGRWDIPLAAWLAPMLLIRFGRDTRPWRAVGLVWLATAIGGQFWLWESGISSLFPLGLLLSTIFTVPFVVDRFAAPRLAGHGFLATLVFPATWVTAEYLTDLVSPTGDIFGSLAATQHGNLPLLQLVSVTGGFGVTFLIAWFAGVANLAWERRVAPRRARRTIIAYTVVLIVVLVGGAVRLGVTPPTADTARMTGIAPTRALNEARGRSFDAADPAELARDHVRAHRIFAPANADLLDRTHREARAGAKVVIWPEAGAQVHEDDRAALLRAVGRVARRDHVYVEVGLGVLTRRAPHIRNEALLIDPEGEVRWTYQKAHPVPGMEDIEPGDGRVPVARTPYGTLANVICFDNDFPGMPRQAARKGADVLFVPSSDWPEFGMIHTQKAELRAIENGVSLFREDNQGVTTAFGPQGRTLASTDYRHTEQQVTVASVPVRGTPTIYSAIGDVFALATLAGLAVLLAYAFRPTRRQRH